MEIEKGQIWLCNELNHKIGEVPAIVQTKYVLIVDGPNEHDQVEFVRVWPLSSEMDMKGDDDLLIENIDALGEKMFAETWNEQPVNVTLLEEIIATIDYNEDLLDGVSFSLTEEQMDFREKEIDSTAFLRDSVFRHINFGEVEHTRGRIIKMRKYLLLVAALVVGAVFLVIQPGTTSDSVLFAENFQPLKANLSPVSTEEEILRSGGAFCKYEYLSKEDCKEAELALSLYNKGDYISAADKLNKLLVPKEKSYELVFYLAIAQLLSNQVEEAISNLQYLNDKNYNTEKVNYYLALAYLKNGQRKKARRLLKQICNQDSEYSDKSCEILKRLRKFSL
jgi:tetratricopeptide (TPR) repeat protein